MELGHGLNPRRWRIALAAALALALAGCAGSNQNAATPASVEQTTVTVTPSATARVIPSPPTQGSSILIIPTAPPAGSPPAAAATPLSQQQLDQLALGTTDLPPGFAVTGSGPGGPELGRDVLASYQEEFQQRDVTSTQSLQQTIVIIVLLGQYRDTSSALNGIRAVNAQSLNQLLGSVNLTAEPASIPAIEEDSAAFHFSGNVSGAAGGSPNGTAVGGYLIVFHRGSLATLILTAAVKGSESLPQTVDLAQKQAQKLRASG